MPNAASMESFVGVQLGQLRKILCEEYVPNSVGFTKLLRNLTGDGTA